MQRALPALPRLVLQRITSEEESRAAEVALRGTFSDGADFAGEASVGYQGGAHGARVYWHEEQSIWACIDESAEPQANRFWNAFGLGDPRTGTPAVVCEVKPPRSGVNRGVAGAFALDPATGKRFLLHNGRIGGGRPGVGQEAFRKHFEGGFVSLEGEPATFALVAALDDENVVERDGEFVRAVAGEVAGSAVEGRGPRWRYSVSGPHSSPSEGWRLRVCRAEDKKRPPQGSVDRACRS